MQFSELVGGRSKYRFFGIFKGDMAILGLEGLNGNIGKFSGFVKIGQRIRDKFGGAKVQFSKDEAASNLPWSTSLIWLLAVPTDHGESS